jgi:hypothetical protein
MLPLLRRRAGPARPLGRAPLGDPARPVGTVHPAAGTGSTHPAATGICNQIVLSLWLLHYEGTKDG